MKIDPLKFKDIQIVLLKKQLIEIQYQNTNGLLNKLLIEAGLEPNKPYKMNEEEFTIEPND